jgi:hypothetical protein
VVKQEPHYCSIPAANIHTTVTWFNSLVQYILAMAIYAEMRWPAFHFENRWNRGVWLLNLYCPSIPDRR